MGTSKTELFTQEQNDLASLAKALAHPARVSIIHYLLATDSCINGDLIHELGLAQATISQHLIELKKVGIIKGAIEGSKKSYCIDFEVWREVKVRFDYLFSQFKQSNEQEECC